MVGIKQIIYCVSAEYGNSAAVSFYIQSCQNPITADYQPGDISKLSSKYAWPVYSIRWP